MSWQWRTDVQPRLQPVTPGSVLFGSSSEEGEILGTWGFRPQVLGYIPNVRGVVTGIPEPSPRGLQTPFKNPKAVVTLRPL